MGSVQVPVGRTREQLMPLTVYPKVCRVQAVPEQHLTSVLVITAVFTGPSPFLRDEWHWVRNTECHGLHSCEAVLSSVLGGHTFEAPYLGFNGLTVKTS